MPELELARELKTISSSKLQAVVGVIGLAWKDDYHLWRTFNFAPHVDVQKGDPPPKDQGLKLVRMQLLAFGDAK